MFGGEWRLQMNFCRVPLSYTFHLFSPIPVSFLFPFLFPFLFHVHSILLLIHPLQPQVLGVKWRAQVDFGRVPLAHTLELVAPGFEEGSVDRAPLGVGDVAVAQWLAQGEGVVSPPEEAHHPVVTPDRLQAQQRHLPAAWRQRGEFREEQW
jgi:hypothetical protein